MPDSDDPTLPISTDRYHVGWICALPIELAAALLMLDEEHGPIQDKDAQDTNSYHAGRIQGHNVVIACLPDGDYGNNAAAVVATNMLRTFKSLKFGLLVGIGGGLPNPQSGTAGFDLRLGDVVVSSAQGTTGGVIQYDRGKQVQKREDEAGHKSSSHFLRYGHLERPPLALRTALASLKAKHLTGRSRIPSFLKNILSDADLEETYSFPGSDNDRLFLPSAVHPDSLRGTVDCSRCDASQIVVRQPRVKPGPRIFYGTILSANRVVKDAVVRNQLRDHFALENALCVETEAAGVMNSFPCMVVRGICDYADSHKNDAWHNYAALTAAALTKDLLSYVSVEETKKEKVIRLDDFLGVMKEQFRPIHDYIGHSIQDKKEERANREEEKYEDTLKECHRQLCPDISYLETKRNIPDRSDGTCNWVFDDPKFKSWATSTHNDLLWVSADPGCGKSVLSKALIDQTLQRQDAPTVSFFFFNNTTGQTHLSMALCAILHQLFKQQQHLRRHAKVPYEQFGPQIRHEPSILWNILMDAAADMDDRSRPIVCVIDALDEAARDSRILLVKQLCRFYKRSKGEVDELAERPSITVKFLVTSRPYETVKENFEVLSDSLPKIHLAGDEKNTQISKEINLVIQEKVEEISRKCKISLLASTRLKEKLIRMEHRTYLWLYLALDEIERTYKYSMDPESVKINAVPTSVDDAYEKILQRVAEEARDTVRRILLIVIGARRALTVGEVSLALGILSRKKADHTRLAENMRYWCGLFIFFNDGKVYLLHSTAKDFLLRQKTTQRQTDRLWKESIGAAEPEESMAYICVQTLCADTAGCKELKPSSCSPSADAGVLAEYAGAFWISHLEASSIKAENPLWDEVSTLYNHMLKPDESLWIKVMSYSRRDLFDYCVGLPIFAAIYASHFDILDNLTDLKIHGYRVDELDRLGRTPLIFAAEYGLSKAVQWLVSHGANINAISKDGETALLQAAKHGHVTILNLLLSNHVILTTKSERSHPLLRAALYGEIECARSLIVAGANLEVEGSYYGNPLQCATYFGHHDMVKLLLQSGADVNAQGGVYGSALQAACVAQNEQVLQTLLSYDPNMNEDGGRFGNALCGAIHGSRYGIQIAQDLTTCSRNIFAMLIQAGADINAACKCDPMIRFLCPEKYAFLFKFAVDGNRWAQAERSKAKRWYSRLDFVEQKRFLTFMQHRYGRLHIDVDQFLANFVNRHGHGPKLGSKAHLAVASLCRGILEHKISIVTYSEDVEELRSRLESSGVNVPIQACDTCDILDNIQTGNEELLGRNAVVHIPRERLAALTRTPLQFACMESNEHIVNLLLNAGADANFCGLDTETPLQIACRIGNLAIVKRLVSSQADANLHGRQGTPSALEYASSHGEVELVNLLISAGASTGVEAQSNNCEALQVAASHGSLAVFRSLLVHRPDVNFMGPRKGTALYAAVEGGSEEIVFLLLQSGAMADLPDQRPTPLQAACRHNRIEIVKVLFAKTVDPYFGYVRESPLQIAIDKGHTVVEALLRRWLARQTHFDTRDISRGGPYSCRQLQSAITKVNIETIIKLLQQGVHINTETCENGTPLFYAALRENKAIFALLLCAGCNIDAIGMFKNCALGGIDFLGNALHGVASMGHFGAARILLAAGIDANARNEFGTPAATARHFGHGVLANWLDALLLQPDRSARAEAASRATIKIGAIANDINEEKERYAHLSSEIQIRELSAGLPC